MKFNMLYEIRILWF